MRGVPGLVLSALMMTGSVWAQEVPNPWRETITGQIEAFRSGDAEAAFGFAGAGFKRSYEDAERFLADIDRAGYGPIVRSRSHSFGTFREVGEDRVVQVVNLVGPDQSLYEAIYQLADEPDLGWRVQGVVLRKAQGLGI